MCVCVCVYNISFDITLNINKYIRKERKGRRLSERVKDTIYGKEKKKKEGEIRKEKEKKKKKGSPARLLLIRHHPQLTRATHAVAAKSFRGPGEFRQCSIYTYPHAAVQNMCVYSRILIRDSHIISVQYKESSAHTHTGI